MLTETDRAGVRRGSRWHGCACAGALRCSAGLTAVDEPASGSDAGIAAPSSLAGAMAAGVEYREGDAVAATATTAAAAVREIVGKGEAAGLESQQQQQQLQQYKDIPMLEGSGSGATSASDPRSLFTIMGLCFLVAIVCALDRVAMSVAIVPMGNVYDYSETTKGLISSVFSWGYMTSMVPSSVLIGVWGPKLTITAGVLVWSAAQMLSPAAAGVSLETLLACRFLMGVGEAVTMPSIQAIVAQWVPQDKMSGWLSLIISGLQIGTVLAYWASPLIVDNWDWQIMFLAYGGLGLAWVALWLPLVADRNPSSSAAAAAEAATAAEAEAEAEAEITQVEAETRRSENGQLAGVFAGDGAGVNLNGVGSSSSSSSATPPFPVETVVLEERSSQEDTGDGGGGEKEGGILEGFLAVPWKVYATNGQIWSIASAHMAHNWGLYVLLAWLPTYFVQEFNLTLEQSSGASVQPWVVGAIVGNVAGQSADFLVNKGLLDLKSVRKLFQTVALVGPAACMLFLAQGPETSNEASALFTAAVALGSCSSAGFGSSVQDLRARDTGVIYGMTSACSAVVGSVGTYLAGVILDSTDSWSMVFQSTAAVYMVGAFVYGALYRAEPLAVKDKSLIL
eukprot:g13783.t1